MAKVKLWNVFQEAKIRTGEISPLEIEALVDTGATLLSLPEELVERLNLRRVEKRKVRYADNRIVEKEIASGVWVEIAGRRFLTAPLVENKGATPLIGQIVLEGLDLHVNPTKGTLEPRPESPDTPMVDML